MAQTIEPTQNIKQKMMRDSNMELMRLLMMFLIVWLHVTSNAYPDTILPVKYLQMFGVPCFIMISGFYGIRASIKGFSKLYSSVVFYSFFALAAIYAYAKLHDASFMPTLGDFVKSFFNLRYSGMWFVKYYVLFYFLSPFYNKVLTGQTLKQRLWLLAVLGLMAFYVPPLNNLNLLEFALYYTLGWTIREYRLMDKFSISFLVAVFLLYCVTIYSAAHFVHNETFQKLLYNFGISYYGILLVFSSVVLFMIFTKLKFSIRWINYFAASTWAVYLLHVKVKFLYPWLNSQADWFGGIDSRLYFVHLIIMSAAVLLACIAIDKFTSPLRRVIARGIEAGANMLLHHSRRIAFAVSGRGNIAE